MKSEMKPWQVIMPCLSFTYLKKTLIQIIVVMLTSQPNISGGFKLSKAILPSEWRMFNIWTKKSTAGIIKGLR